MNSQVANFHNTIETQIVHSQKGLLLSLAREFERLATSPQVGDRDEIATRHL